MLSKRFSKSLLAGAAVVGLSSSAQAALTMDVWASFINNVPIPKTKLVTQALGVGDTVTLEVRAVVTGSDPTKFQAFQSASGSMLSTGGTMRGSLLASGHFLAPQFGANSSSVGLSQDLDGDGDLDLGSNANADAADFIAYRANVLTGPNQTQPNGASVWNAGFEAFPTTAGTSHTYFVTEFVDFIVGAVGNGQTSINFRPRTASTAATWSENANEAFTTLKDGKKVFTYNGGTPGDPLTQFVAGAPVVIGIPEPTSLALVGVASLLAGRRRR